MAKYTITYKCEHDGEVNIVGPEKERPGKREWLATQLCPDCRRAAAALNLEAWIEARGLVTLDGTEKQVAWANKIRKELLEDMERFVDRANAAPENPEADYILRGYKWTCKQSKAVWWIDCRNNTGRTLLVAMIEALKANDAKQTIAK